MTEQTLITQEMRDFLGKEGQPEHYEVEKGHIRRFAEAIDDPNPLWVDVEYARKSRFGTIIAPPLFLIDIGINSIALKLLEFKGPLEALINVGMEIDFYKPIKAGDTITTTAKLIDVQEKQGSRGRLVFFFLEINYSNQNGELVRRCKDTFMRPEHK